MTKIEEMNKWNYSKTWSFFTENAVNRFIPESELYLRSLKLCPTKDIREDKDAKKIILESLKKKSLILIDGSSLNGKTTFATRLSNQTKASIVDIDLICKEWIEQYLLKNPNSIDKFSFMMKMDKLTDIYP